MFKDILSNSQQCLKYFLKHEVLCTSKIRFIPQSETLNVLIINTDLVSFQANWAFSSVMFNYCYARSYCNCRFWNMRYVGVCISLRLQIFKCTKSNKVGSWLIFSCRCTTATYLGCIFEQNKKPCKLIFFSKCSLKSKTKVCNI